MQKLSLELPFRQGLPSRLCIVLRLGLTAEVHHRESVAKSVQVTQHMTSSQVAFISIRGS